jgi:uncharacterized membrane protein
MIEARKPEPEPGWARSLWPKPMTIERICLEARLNSWHYIIVALIVADVFLGSGVFFIWNSLYGSHPWRPFQGILIGTFSIFIFSIIVLYVIAVIIAKIIIAPRRSFDPDYRNVDRLLPIRPKRRRRLGKQQ